MLTVLSLRLWLIFTFLLIVCDLYTYHKPQTFYPCWPFWNKTDLKTILCHVHRHIYSPTTRRNTLNIPGSSKKNLFVSWHILKLHWSANSHSLPGAGVDNHEPEVHQQLRCTQHGSINPITCAGKTDVLFGQINMYWSTVYKWLHMQYFTENALNKSNLKTGRFSDAGITAGTIDT